MFRYIQSALQAVSLRSFLQHGCLYKNKGLKYNKSRALIKFSSKQRSWVEAKLSLLSCVSSLTK